MTRVARLAIALGVALLAAGPASAQVDGKVAPDGKGKADAKPEDRQPVTIDSDRMDRFGKESLVIFTGNVVARHNGSVQYADRMEVYLDEKGDRVLRTVSTGGVRIITRDCKTGTAKRAEYFDLDQRVVLIGNARVWQEDNVVSGETITMYLSQDRSVAQSGRQERVKGVFYQKDDGKASEDGKAGQASPAGRPRAAASCTN